MIKKLAREHRLKCYTVVLVHEKLGAGSDTHGEVGTGAVLMRLTVVEQHRLVKLL